MPKQCIFGSKVGGSRYQGIMTRRGAIRFEERRRELAIVADVPLTLVSDADVFEFLARGLEETIEYLGKTRRRN